MMKINIGGVDVTNSLIGTSTGRAWEVKSKSPLESFRDFTEVMNAIREKGFWEGVYGRSFFEIIVDFFKELGHDIAHFIVSNGDIFFLLPAILIIMATFFIGRNRYTKFTIPFAFLYFLSTFFRNFL